MKLFRMMQIEEAKAYAMAGGQALHLHNIIADDGRAPQCFVRAMKKGEWIAHLFDQDWSRLCLTAGKLGVWVIVVEHTGQPGQHIALCGKPLSKAIAMCPISEVYLYGE